MEAVIVDDDRFVLKGLKQLIPWEEIGYESVHEFLNGENSWVYIQNSQPDLVITDVRMPGLDGIELARRIHETMSKIHVIMLSAYADFTYAQAAICYNVQSYLLKPLNEERLQQLIEQIREIAQEEQSYRQYLKMRLITKTDQEKIVGALTEGRLCKIDDFFNRYIIGLQLHGEGLVNYCMDLVALLFGYFEETGMNRDVSISSRKKVFSLLLSQKSDQGVLQQTYRLYVDAMRVSARKVPVSKQVVSMISNYIENHYRDPDLSVSKISDTFHFSPVYVGSLFRKAKGMNIIQFITQLRMKEAVTLLRDPSNRIQDISRMVGYTDPQYFGKVFKKVYSISPTEFRQMTVDFISGN